MALEENYAQFRIGEVLSKTFTRIFENWQQLLIFAGLVGLAQAAASALMMSRFAPLLNPNDPTAALGLFKTPFYWIALIGGLLISSFSHAGLIHSMDQKEAGNESSLGEVFAHGLRLALPVLGLTLLWYLGVMVGSMLLVIPGLIVMTMWSVSLPSIITEGTGVLGAFGRSRALTNGIRWPVFGALLVFFIAYSFMSFAFQGFSRVGLLKLYQTSSILGMGVTLIMSTVMSILLASFLYSLFVEVRHAKEGRGTTNAAEVFV